MMVYVHSGTASNPFVDAAAALWASAYMQGKDAHGGKGVLHWGKSALKMLIGATAEKLLLFPLALGNLTGKGEILCIRTIQSQM